MKPRIQRPYTATPGRQRGAVMVLVVIAMASMLLMGALALDGGHLLFYGVEAIQRRPVSPRVQDWAYRSGLAVLLAMMMLVTFNDLSSFGLWERLSGLIG